MKWVEVDFQGHKHRVPALRSGGRLWFHWQGETHVIDVARSSRRASSEVGTAQAGVISAPMPGKVTRVHVKAGDAVSKGQALVVMEAMKMEYTLEADRDGKVAEVRAQAGTQVALGEVLVRVGDK